jgi:hypothetical protein
MTRPRTAEKTVAAQGKPRVHNADVDWGLFDPEWYRAHNYGTLRDDDRTIIGNIRNFFAGANLPVNAQGVDVGSGANLYPTFAMLPFCRHVDLIEFSATNVLWLKKQVGGFDRAWDPFWSAFSGHPAYRTVTDPRTALAERASVTEKSVFDLPRSAWDIGTMFFVACSISTVLEEFREALHRFIGSLKPDAPFAAAFMDHSEGYVVNGNWFPAVQIGVDDVKSALAPVAYNVKIERISSSTLRDGYKGMILAWGRRSRPSTQGTATRQHENPASPTAS